MKPLWMPTLAWIVAIAIAVLFALANPDTLAPNADDASVPHGSSAPR